MIVVAGASGFIGRALVAELAGRGLPVLAVSRRPITFDCPAQTLLVRSYSELEPTAPGSVLIYLAEPRDLAAAEDKGEGYIAERRAAFAGLLCKPWSYVVYASSAAVYGDAGHAPHRTDEAIAPLGIYARAKAACEQDALAGGGAVARISNVYGSGMASNNIIADIVGQLAVDRPLMIRDLRPVRDYLWIDDLAKGLTALTMSRRRGIFNFGSGQGHSVGEVARLLLDYAGQSGRSIQATETARESCLVLDVSGTTARLGWKPSVSIEQGLAKILGVA